MAVTPLLDLVHPPTRQILLRLVQAQKLAERRIRRYRLLQVVALPLRPDRLHKLLQPLDLRLDAQARGAMSEAVVSRARVSEAYSLGNLHDDE